MPNRPGHLVQQIPAYNPPRAPATQEREILPEISCNVLESSPTNNQTPTTNFGPAGQYTALLRFDVRGLQEGLAQFVNAMLMWSVTSGQDITTLTIGRIADADAASWTAAATFNTKDGAVAWSGGAGAFTNVGTEISVPIGRMPGVSTGSNYANLAQGTWPTNIGLYHPRYDPGMDSTVLATVASFLNSCMSAHSGKINIYVRSASTSAACRAGDTTTNTLSRMRLVYWNVNINTGLFHWGPADAGSTLYPPHQVYSTNVASNNDSVIGHPYIDMTMVDDANATVRGYNYHGGVSPTTSTNYDVRTATAAGTSESYGLIHIDLTEFLGMTFSKVILSLTGGSSTGGAGSVGTTALLVGQTKDTWAVGNGGGASSTTGPTFNHQAKEASVAWPSGFTPRDAGFLDTTAQAETACTLLTGSWGGTSNTASTSRAEADITAMANRALTNYAGHLWLRVRTTSAAGGSNGFPNSLMGPTKYAKNNPTLVQQNLCTNGSGSSIGYNGWPRLRIKTVDPVP